MSYYSLSSYLVEEQKIPCKFGMVVPDMGHLEGTAEQHLPANTVLPLPYWLAQPLAVREMVSVSLPRAFAGRIRNALNAGATSVNLRTVDGGGYFFASGVRFEELIEDPSLLQTLEKAFRERSKAVMDLSQGAVADASKGGSSGGPGGEFWAGMDEWEKELYQASGSSAKSMKGWLEQSNKASASSGARD